MQATDAIEYIFKSASWTVEYTNIDEYKGAKLSLRNYDVVFVAIDKNLLLRCSLAKASEDDQKAMATLKKLLAMVAVAYKDSEAKLVLDKGFYVLESFIDCALLEGDKAELVYKVEDFLDTCDYFVGNLSEVIN